MPVDLLEFEPTAGLAAELAVHDGRFDEAKLKTKLKKLRKKYPTLASFLSDAPDTFLRDLNRFLRDKPKGLKILDVGFGSGQSTLLMASLGHYVSGLEPSKRACYFLDGFASHFGLEVKLYCGTGEVADKISDDGFDLVVFNSSLHHCDDPGEVLRNCRKKLKPDGCVFLHEPILKPFRTKGWYYRMLEEQPERMGHYGGNEHIYYSWEYVRLLEGAGFSKIHTKLLSSSLPADLKRAFTPGKKSRAASLVARDAVHVLWHAGILTAGRVRGLRALLTKASLLPVDFVAYP